jgi:hypothetical protein
VSDFINIAANDPALMLQIGVPKISCSWQKNLSYLTPQLQVVAAMRGLDDSTHPDSGYDMATVADNFAKLMQQLGHDRFHMCGEDWVPLLRIRLRRDFRMKC